MPTSDKEEKLSDYIEQCDAATLRSALRVLADFSGGNEKVSTAIRLLRAEEFEYFKRIRTKLDKAIPPPNCSRNMSNCPDDSGEGCWCQKQQWDIEVHGG